jgi:hypothetical protein
MSELFARLPSGIRSDPSICLNPFDQSWLDQLGDGRALADAMPDDQGTSAD